jgi:GNAT superfamily N-acetyltransferase
LRVRDDWQRHGIGTQLVVAAEGYLRAHGFTTATIAVGKENTPALQLYQHLGYVTFSDDPGEWYFTDDQGFLQREDEQSWILEKKL